MEILAQKLIISGVMPAGKVKAKGSSNYGPSMSAILLRLM